jgi:hypothetical protein
MADIRNLTFLYNSGDVQAPIFLDEFPHEFRAVQLYPKVAGVGYLQGTLCTREEVLDNEAVWVTWPNGSISAVAQDTIDPTVTAIRVYRTSGSLQLDVRLV